MELNKSATASSSHRAHEATRESFALLGEVATADEMLAAL